MVREYRVEHLELLFVIWQLSLDMDLLVSPSEVLVQLDEKLLQQLQVEPLLLDVSMDLLDEQLWVS